MGSGIIVDITERRIVIQCVAPILEVSLLGCAFSTDFNFINDDNFSGDH